jgi:hypothetical protein
MNERLKQALMILGFVVVTAGLGYAIYFFFFRPTAPTPVAVVPPGATQPLPSAGTAAPGQPSAPVPPGGLPSAPGIIPPTFPSAVSPEITAKTTVLNTNVSQAISLSPSGGVRLYDAIDGKFYRILDDGTHIALADQQFFNVDKVYWGNKTDKAVITYPDGTKTMYDFASKKQVTLPKLWEDFSFSPEDNQLVTKSVGNNEDNRFLVVANPDGSNAQAVESMGQNHELVHANWSPNNQVVAYAFTADSMGLDRQAVVMVGKNRENFKNLIVEGRGFVPNWSPSGGQILYSVYNSSDDYKPSLWISGAVGDQINANRRNISIATWADKCVWQNETTIFCAVPTRLDAGAGLQRELSNDIPDAIYRIDLATARVANLGQPEGNPSINQLQIASDGKSVYFNDRVTGRLIRYEF